MRLTKHELDAIVTNLYNAQRKILPAEDLEMMHIETDENTLIEDLTPVIMVDRPNRVGLQNEVVMTAAKLKTIEEVLKHFGI